MLPVSLNIKNPDATRLIRELAEATGESLTQALTTAVRERLDRVRAQEPNRDDRIWAIVGELRSRLPEGYLDQNFDALLYDEGSGLPK
jgi:antitoxin VapB